MAKAGYQYLSSLGKGAFAEVYKAIDQTHVDQTTNSTNDKPQCVAIKKLARHCKSEIYIHKKVKHNNIVQLYDVIHDGQFNYLILELCNGGTLRELLDNKNNNNFNVGNLNNNNNNNNNYSGSIGSNTSKQLPVLDYHHIRAIIKQLCEALIYLHRNSIIHRDINLNNLLIADKLHKQDTHGDIYIKLADFGLAIDVSLSNRNHHSSIMPVGDTICGTPGFIAPEVVNGQQVPSPSNDAFSVGVVLFSMITGCCRPKLGQLKSTLAQLPPLAADLITSLLRSDPKDRISIEDVLTHPFVIGPISALRLPYLCKRTKTMEITSGYSPKLSSLTSPTSIETNVDGTLVAVVDKDGITRNYTLETLPKIHWKKYYHLSAFVDLVKAKVVKVNFYCNKISANGLLIERCCLMENSSLEIKISYPRHTMKKSHIILFGRFETRFENHYVPASELKDICTQCRILERNLDKQVRRLPSSTQNYNIFPATFGQKSSKTRSFSSSIDSKRDSRTENRWNTSIDCGEITEQPSRFNSLNPHVVKFANQSDSGLEFLSDDMTSTDYLTSLDNGSNSCCSRNVRVSDNHQSNNSINCDHNMGPPTRFIPVQHDSVSRARQSLGCLEVSFKDGTKLTIIIGKKIIYEYSINKLPIEVDISTKNPDLSRLPNELLSKIQIAQKML